LEQHFASLALKENGAGVALPAFKQSGANKDKETRRGRKSAMPGSFAPRREDLALEALGLLDVERRLGFAISVQSRAIAASALRRAPL
jgi:hypothetical protein